MGSINREPRRFEVTKVYSHPQAKAEIILVHGLNGNPRKTWTSGTPPNDVYWPTDLLPTSLQNDHADILVYGYNADVFTTTSWPFFGRRDGDKDKDGHHDQYGIPKASSPSDNDIRQHAQSLVATLTAFRKSQGTERLPLIWVAHSLGGILTKAALLYSSSVRTSHQEELRGIFVSTYAIIFLGTPHLGSDAAALGLIVQRMVDSLAPRKWFDSESVLLKTLKKDSETLRAINDQFLEIYQKFRIHMVHENHKTDVKGTKVLIVDPSSAGPQLPGVRYYGIEATHSGMCKFASVNAPGYLTVSTALREWVHNAPEVIAVRWLREEQERRDAAYIEAADRIHEFARSPLNSQQHLSAGDFHNERLIQHHVQLHLPGSTTPKLLADRTPLRDGTHSQRILLPASDDPPPPQASAHTASQHDYHSQLSDPLFIVPHHFRNSYFIGRENELQRLHEMLMDRKRRSEGTSAVLIQGIPGVGKTHLARQYIVGHRWDYPGGIFWVRAKSRGEMDLAFAQIAHAAVAEMRARGIEANYNEGGDPDKTADFVVRWLSGRKDWLMVFDGVHFDTPGLDRFIPDVPGTSIIYTSTETAVPDEYRFDSPQKLELGVLTKQQAQELLLWELDRSRSWSAEDKTNALQLVELMGRLPIMIHQAAQQMKETREPLAKYLRSYKKWPQVSDVPSFKKVKEELENRGETAALNLISLLVWFDQHIPVEMVMLGLSALDKVTPVRTPVPGRALSTLNSTLRILIAFGLIQRYESGDFSPISSRTNSKRSLDSSSTSSQRTPASSVNSHSYSHHGHLDILRIHSVIQAFFIDAMYQQNQAAFWLSRAVAVWCKAFDEADRRICASSHGGNDSPSGPHGMRVGLPDDYRQFAIHGQKLLSHVEKYEKRYNNKGIESVRGSIEQRLGKIPKQIEELTQTIQQLLQIGDNGEERPLSVFDRVCSAPSESERSGTLSSHDSQMSSGPTSPGEGPDGEGVGDSQSSWLAPYPRTMHDFPVPPIDDDQATEVPPSMTATQVLVGSPDMASEASFPATPKYPDDFNPSTQWSASYTDWRSAIPPHRVIRRQESRRYRDRVGAWRSKDVQDPRAMGGDPLLGLNMDAATGTLPRRDTAASGSSRPSTAPSEAQSRLSKIKYSANRSFTGGLRRIKQVLPARRSSVASVPQASTAAAVPPSNRPPTISLGIDDLHPDITFSQQRPFYIDPHGTNSLRPTANSSPAQLTSPFPPPSFTGIPTSDLIAPPNPSNSAPNLPATAGIGVAPGVTVRQWNTTVTQPDGTSVNSSLLEWSSPGSSPVGQTVSGDAAEVRPASYPTTSGFPPHHQGQDHKPHPLPPLPVPAHPFAGALINHSPIPAGYSSQPMSRSGSHQSSVSISLSPSPGGLGIVGHAQQPPPPSRQHSSILPSQSPPSPLLLPVQGVGSGSQPHHSGTPPAPVNKPPSQLSSGTQQKRATLQLPVTTSNRTPTPPSATGYLYPPPPKSQSPSRSSSSSRTPSPSTRPSTQVPSPNPGTTATAAASGGIAPTPIPAPSRRRAPSVTETEPSPRTLAGVFGKAGMTQFDEDETSHAQWARRHGGDERGSGVRRTFTVDEIGRRRKGGVVVSPGGQGTKGRKEAKKEGGR